MSSVAADKSICHRGKKSNKFAGKKLRKQRIWRFRVHKRTSKINFFQKALTTMVMLNTNVKFVWRNNLWVISYDSVKSSDTHKVKWKGVWGWHLHTTTLLSRIMWHKGSLRNTTLESQNLKLKKNFCNNK